MTTDSSNPDDVSLVSMFTSFTPITEYPLPFSAGFDEFIETHPQFDADADSDMHVDKLHDEYINEIARNDEWSVFTVELYGYDDVYVWNHQLGEGLRIPRDEWGFGMFAEVISLARETDTGWNRNSDAATGSDGCPYCDAPTEMSSSLRPSGSYNQACDECGRSRLIG